ncbi:MAG: anthranilate synthase component I [Eubacterium sp.]|jgi:anthranilate synthase component 1|nr:anthranilate synthase component I [Eubacterium sp.]
MIYPSFAQAKELGAKGNRIPVKMELYADTLTPVLAVRRLKKLGSHCFLLESAQKQRRWGRYSFLGYEPAMEITCRNGMVKITAGSTVTTEQTEHPGRLIRRIMEENRAPRMEEMPPFCGGLVGYFSYDYLKYSEPSLVMDAPDEEAFQDADLMLFDKVAAFDHYRQKVILIVNIRTDNIGDSYRKAELTLKKMAETLIHGELAENPPLRLKSSFRYLFGKKEYCGIVERAKQYIREGDIFQVVLSNRIEADIEGSLFDTYRILRSSNPSPYMFYLSSDELEIAGASPETLVRLENGVLHTYPLAGTKKRGSTREEDLALEQNLLSDEKERAEHNMLVDLGRNDLSKISRIGSVEVEKYMCIERFSHVMHIGSTVTGKILDEKDALDAVDAVLPAGTLSGAPKLRACEIIHELERTKRGIYGGAIGYIDFTGNLDTCIAIRIAYAKHGKVFVRSGAGIVADSVPEMEFAECENKAKAVMQALQEAEGGIDL